jgi:hypothetical protein
MRMNITLFPVGGECRVSSTEISAPVNKNRSLIAGNYFSALGGLRLTR